MNIKALLGALIILSTAYWVWYREGPFEAEALPSWLSKNSSNDDSLQPIAETVRQIPVSGDYLHNIMVEPGIRAMSGEIATPGEVKIALNLPWQQLPGEPDLRDALDHTAAHVISAVFLYHDSISKIRLLIKIPKKRKQVDEDRMGKAQGYKNAAKVFSITRSAWETARRSDPYAYDPESAQGPQNILSLGDYVILTGAGWRRGY